MLDKSMQSLDFRNIDSTGKAIQRSLLARVLLVQRCESCDHRRRSIGAHSMSGVSRFTALALVLSLASIVVTRVFRAFTVAEVLALLAFAAGVAVLIAHRQLEAGTALPWPNRLVVAGSVIGLVGLVVKLLFVALGIGVAEHDMSSHDGAGPNPLLQHIHHLFFNIGFLFMLIASIGMAVRRFRRRRN